MKAIDIKTNETVYVLDLRDNNGNIIRYISDNKSYMPEEIQVVETEIEL